MNYTFGLIGCGNMGSAVACAVSQVTHNGILANRTPQRAQKLAEQLSFSWGSNTETAEKSRFLFLGVKPHLMSDVLQELQPVLAARETKPILVSMAAGLTISQLEEMAGGTCPVIRIMPNTPVSVGQGVILSSQRMRRHSWNCWPSPAVWSIFQSHSLMQGPRFPVAAQPLHTC